VLFARGVVRTLQRPMPVKSECCSLSVLLWVFFLWQIPMLCIGGRLWYERYTGADMLPCTTSDSPAPITVSASPTPDSFTTSSALITPPSAAAVSSLSNPHSASSPLLPAQSLPSPFTPVTAALTIAARLATRQPLILNPFTSNSAAPTTSSPPQPPIA
jgi:hypothetical protein